MKRYRALIAGVVAVLVLGAVTYARRTARSNVTYREIGVERADLTTTIQATGTVQPENRLEIKAPIAGRAERVVVAEGQKVRRGQVLAWMSSSERAALLDAAHSEGAAEEARWETIYKPTAIMAPIDGTIITRSVEAGQTFTAADAILVMSDRLTVKAQVDETDIALVRLGQRASLQLDAYPNERVEAKVDQIAFEAKTVSNVTTYTVDVLPRRTPAFMRAGMTANVTFESESRPAALLIPSEAIRVEDGGSTVLTRAPSGAPVPTPVTTGLSDGKRTEVTGGLNEGDRVLMPEFKLGERATGASNPFMPTAPKKTPRGPRPPGH